MTSQHKIVEKIRKLLRLGRGTDHQAEAEAALSKAHELASEAGIAIEGVDADVMATRITHEAGGVKRRTHARKRCHVLLRKHFGVDVLGGSVSGSIYIGPAINIAIARHIETYLMRQCAAAWSEHAELIRGKKKKTKQGMRLAFEQGFFHGVMRVLAERPIRNDAVELAAAIEVYTADIFKIRTTKMPAPPSKYDAARWAGISRGRETPCNRPVSGAMAQGMIGGGE